MKKSKIPQNEPKTLRNGVFLTDEDTHRMVPFQDTSFVMMDMHMVRQIQPPS